MEGVIILFFSVALFFTGIFCGTIIFDDLKNNTKAQLLFVLCVLAISIETTLFCESINKCCSESSKAKMEFSLDEYDMSKKTIVVEKGDTIKTNTIYFFEEKNKQKSKKN